MYVLYTCTHIHIDLYVYIYKYIYGYICACVCKIEYVACVCRTLGNCCEKNMDSGKGFHIQ
jgi:hypothetical protein